MYDLHLLGWRDFQNLCATICRVIFGQTIQSFQNSADGGRDAAFQGTWKRTGSEEFSGHWVIQAKFTSKRDKNLRLSDVAPELKKAKSLVSSGECDTYILITNAGLSGPIDLKVKAAFKKIGVKYVAIYGYDWICQTIKENNRLRMHVPRLYGLGDLSTILDERAYAQSKALLDSMKDDLAKVVITSAYTRASDALDKHKFVLLVGEPAAGKTTIASMLSLAATDLWRTNTLKLDEASQVTHQHWNPEGPPQFFWIDDAFGMTQFDIGRVSAWNHSFSRVEAMLKQGSRIVMTSRDYIYARARYSLKKGAFPLLEESQVVIDVKDLSPEERHQILYNHIKLGSQGKRFKTTIKPWLHAVANHPRFIPETARRLGNPFFTKSLYLSLNSVLEFVERQRELLLEIIEGLDVDSRAALSLIYMRNGSLDSPIELRESERGAIRRFGSEEGAAIAELQNLRGSLVNFSASEDKRMWVFKHPTIRDAFASFLLNNPELLGIYVQGAVLRDLMNEVTCGNIGHQGAVALPSSLFALMNMRLHEGLSLHEPFKRGTTPIRSLVVRFLTYRCSDSFLTQFPLHANLLEDMAHPGLYLHAVDEVGLAIHLQKLGLLPEDCRKDLVSTVTEYAIKGQDFDAFRNAQLASIFTEEEHERLLELAVDEMIPSLQAIERDWRWNFDSEEDPNDYIAPLINGLEAVVEELEELDKKDLEGAAESIALIRTSMDRLRNWASEEESDKEDSESSDSLADFRFNKAREVTSAPLSEIFDDVDE